MTTTAEMPKYRCHKEVWALKIKDVQIEDGQCLLSFEEPGYAPIDVGGKWYDRHQPEQGGYYVVYKDGYKSYSPSEAFEDGYTRVS